MHQWQSFGVSLIGPGHIKKNIPNQDYFLEEHGDGFDCIVIADGVGSSKHSDIGSAFICNSVIKSIKILTIQKKEFIIEHFIEKIKDIFLHSIAPININECATTCLFAVHIYNKVYVGMLGDGLCSVVLENNEIKTLSDDKSDKFSNITTAMSKNTKFTDWKTLEFLEKEFKSVLLCTDGISDDLNDDIKRFVLDFSNNYCTKNKTKMDIVTDILESLLKWKVLRHSDDKTIACLYKIGDF